MKLCGTIGFNGETIVQLANFTGKIQGFIRAEQALVGVFIAWSAFFVTTRFFYFSFNFYCHIFAEFYFWLGIPFTIIMLKHLSSLQSKF